MKREVFYEIPMKRCFVVEQRDPTSGTWSPICSERLEAEADALLRERDRQDPFGMFRVIDPTTGEIRNSSVTLQYPTRSQR